MGIAADAAPWTNLLQLPWPQARAAARERVEAGGVAEIAALLALQPADPGESWLTDVVRRQLPLAAHAAAALGDSCPAELGDRLAAECAQWIEDMPQDLVEQALKDLPAGAFRRALGVAILARLRAIPAGEDDDERAKAAQPMASALVLIEPREALPELAAALADADPLVRGFVAIVLGSLQLELPSLLRLHASDPDENVRFRARLALGLNKTAEALPPLLSALRDPDDAGGAASALAAHGSTEAGAALVEAMQADLMVQLELQLTGDGVPDLSAASSEELVTKLLKQLKSRNDDKRLAAVSLLHALRAERAVPALVRSLVDKSDLVPNAAVEALAAMKAVAAAPDLVRCLKSRDVTLVRDAATALGAIDATDAAPELCGVLKRASDEQVRAAAAQALGGLGSAEAIPLLVGALADVEPIVRSAAAKALGQLAAAQASGSLARCLGDSSPAVAGEACRALGRLAGPLVASRLALPARSSVRGEPRDGALEGLWSLAERLSLLPAAAGGAASPSPGLDLLLDAPWTAAVNQGLAQLGALPAEAQDSFVESLLRHERDGERGWTTDVLARQVPLAFRLAAEYGDRFEAIRAELVERMLEWVTSLPTAVTESPLRSLHGLPAPVCAELARALVRELAESDESPRRDKLQAALGTLRPRSEERAIVALATGKKRGMRRVAVSILAAFSTPAADNALRAAAADRDHLVRLIAATALTDGSRGPGLDVLRSALADPSMDLRLAMVERLGRIAGEEGTRLLRTALADRRKDVRAAAAARLACRGDQDGLRAFLEILAADETDDADPVEAANVFQGIDDSAGILARALEQATQGQGWVSEVAQFYLDRLAEAQSAPLAVASAEAAGGESVPALVAKAESRTWEAEAALVALWSEIERGRA